MSNQVVQQPSKGGEKAQQVGANQQQAEPEMLQAGVTAQRVHEAPGTLTPANMMWLQRTIGNQAVQQFVQRRSTRRGDSPASQPPVVVQPKLTVGPAHDRYEQEADEVAARVMRMPARAPAQGDGASKQGKAQSSVKSAAKPILSLKTRQQRKERELQASGDSAAPVGLQGGPVSSSVESSIRSARGGGRALPELVRRKMEGGIGADFSGVRIHTGTHSNKLNRSLGAKAFTAGSDVFFQSNQYNPHSSGGTRLLAHELTHVVQQGAASQKVRRMPATMGAPGAMGTPETTGTPAAKMATDPVRQGGAKGLVQRKPNPAQVLAYRKRFLDLKLDVVDKFGEQNWGMALTNMRSQAVAYRKANLWARTGLAKWSRNLSNTLDPLRVRAKALIPTKDTRKPEDVTKEIVKIAKSAGGVKATQIGDSNLEYGVGMMEKLAFYLAAALPSSIRDMYDQYLNITPDLTSVFAGGSGPKGGDGSKSVQVSGDETTLKKELGNGSMANRGYHGSASWLLEGLGKSGGKLLSQKSAFDAGLLKTGEGTTFSSGASLKTNVYIGKGEMGFATAASYALAPGSLTSYNVSLLSDKDLGEMIETYEEILQHEDVIAQLGQMATSGIGEAIKQNMLAQAKKGGVDPSKDKEYNRINTLQTKVQLEEMLGKLRKEQGSREGWKDDDARRKGNAIPSDNYPILLDFDLTGLSANLDPMGVSRVQGGDYRLAGEATVADSIDLTGGRLKVVYCPEQFIPKTIAKLKDVFGDGNGIEVRALESISGAVDRSTEAGKTLDSTYGQLEKQQRLLDIKIKAQGDVSKHMLNYVDKNKKDMLHSSITKGMIGSVAPVTGSLQPEALLMMGGPGSGKSTIIESILDPKERKNMVVADADAIKAKLPSYRADLKAGKKDAASKAHAESKKIVKNLLDEVIVSRRNLLYDATGANKKEYQELISQLKKAGYKTYMVMTQITADEGVSRVNSRAAKTGRSVPEDIVRAVYRSAPVNFAALAPSVDQAYVYDNMTKPKLVWSTGMDVTKLNEVLGLG